MKNVKKDVNAAGNRKKGTGKGNNKKSRIINDNWIFEWFLLSNLSARLNNAYSCTRVAAARGYEVAI